MSWFRSDPPKAPEPKFIRLPLDHYPVPIPESMEDMVRRIIREELDRRFGPLSE